MALPRSIAQATKGCSHKGKGKSKGPKKGTGKR